MHRNPAVLHALLTHLSESLVTYVSYQIQSGAQVVQLFDSWASHLSPEQFKEFSLPYAEYVIRGVKKKHPEVPLILHLNGGSGKLDTLTTSTADVVGLDWGVTMEFGRQILGKKIVQGNVDPTVLFGTEDAIHKAVSHCLIQAGRNGHILNLGHGVIQQTPEDNVAFFCELARQSAKIFENTQNESTYAMA